MPSPPPTPPDDLSRAFRRRFGRSPEVAARAPGRVNLIGEHTDYNDGLVLPCAIDRDTWALAAARGDRRFEACSRELGEGEAFELGTLARRGSWTDYAQGVCAALAERGCAFGGADVYVGSEVPPGSGLSSSAALGVAVATALDRRFGLGLTAAERAAVAHRGESGFVGVGCGVMDPMASALGRAGEALRIDCRSLAVEPVPLPAEGLAFLVAHSGVSRSLQDGRYAARRRDCEAALAAGQAVAPAAALRDFGPEDLPRLERALDATRFRRARHVILENARVDATADALRAGDLPAAGRLLREGMRSLREDFEVSGPELDALCEIGDALPGVYGSRLTGAGFGGCTLHLAATEATGAASAALGDAFAARFGRRPQVLVARPSEGARAVNLT